MAVWVRGGLLTGYENFQWINSFGQLAIGGYAGLNVPTTLVEGAIQVQATASAGPIVTLDSYLGLTLAPAAVLGRAINGTPAAASAALSGNTLLRLSGGGYGATGISVVADVIISLVAAENFTDTARGTLIRFATTKKTTTTLLTRVTIGDDGEVVIASGPARQFTASNVSGGRSSFVDSAHAATLDYTLPSAQSVASFLHNNGAGALSWIADANDTFTQYTKLAGRTGTTNDTILSTTADGTLAGSSAAAGNLFLRGTTNATPGIVKIVGTGTLDDTAVSMSALRQVLQLGPNGYTVTAADVSLRLLAGPTTVQWNVTDAIAVEAATVSSLLTIFQNNSGVAMTKGPVAPIDCAPTFRANNAALTLTQFTAALPAVAGLKFRPGFDRVGTPASTVTDAVAVMHRTTVGAGWTLTDSIGLRYLDDIGAGTVTNQVAVDVAALTRGGTLNVAMRSAITAAATRWFLLDTGGAASSVLGSLRLGAASAAATGGSTLHVDGGMTKRRTTFGDANYTALVTDLIIECTTQTASRTVNLPAAATAAAGKIYIIKKGNTAAFTLVVDASGAETIDGALTVTIPASAFGVVRLYCTGAAWRLW